MMEPTIYRSIDELPLMLRVPDIAKILDIGKNKAYDLVNSGAIKSIKIGTQIRVPKESIVEYLNS